MLNGTGYVAAGVYNGGLIYGDYYLLEAVRYWDELPPALADEATKAAAAL